MVMQHAALLLKHTRAVSVWKPRKALGGDTTANPRGICLPPTHKMVYGFLPCCGVTLPGFYSFECPKL